VNRWIIVPAAGTGSRFGGDVPKQYQLLNDKKVIEHTLERVVVLVGTYPNSINCLMIKK